MTKGTAAVSLDRSTVLRWTASVGAITAEALAELQDATLASARSYLAVAVREGQLVRERPLVAQPALYVLTPAGLRASGLAGAGPSRVTASNATHLIACTRVAATLSRSYADHTLMGERELRHAERAAAAPIASAVLGRAPGGGPLLHRPDLVLSPREPERGGAVAVEVELTIKAPRRLTEICRAWARCRHVAGVLYIAPPDVQRALDRAIEAAGAAKSVVVVPLDALLQDAPGDDAPPLAKSVPSET
jgi:hypothetical protein